MDLKWAVNVWHQCEDAGVPFFMKQYGSALAKDLGMKGKGSDPSEWGLRFPREFPPLLKGKTNDK